ncbi:MAG: DUF7309 domain-containing protein [Acetivibrionales bacterium]|jgi:hypothetical protein
MLKTNKPTIDEWSALYKAAENFKNAACWKWMYDNDIFGVQDPETGEIAYCCIMGNAGEHFAIAGYLGTEGLDSILKLLSGEIEPSDPDNMYLQKCLMCSFEDRAALASEDLKIIKNLGLKFRGRNEWPAFRHYEPGFFPWFLTASQCRFLTHIITQALEVSVRCRESKKILEHKTLYTYLVRTNRKPGNGDSSWEDRYIDIEPFKPEFVSFHIKDEMRLKRLVSTKPIKGIVLEADTFFTPYYPKVCMLLDHHRGMVVSFEMMTDLKKEGYKCIEMLVNFIERNSIKPSKILVSREETYYLYVDVCKQLGITLEAVDHLEFAGQVRHEMFSFMMR